MLDPNKNLMVSYAFGADYQSAGSKVFDLPVGRRFFLSLVGGDGADVTLQADGSWDQQGDDWVDYPDMPLTEDQMFEFTSAGRTKLTWGAIDAAAFCVKIIPVTYNS